MYNPTHFGKKASHHHAPRSPQKTKQKPIEIVTDDEEVVETFTQIEAAEEVVSPSLISSAVTEPQMPRELRSTKETNDVGKNGKMASDFMIRRLSGGPLQNPEGLKKL